jgi:hypothetical protein
MTNHSESYDEIFALEEKCNINNNDQNIITKQDYIPEIATGVLTDVITVGKEMSISRIVIVVPNATVVLLD